MGAATASCRRRFFLLSSVILLAFLLHSSVSTSPGMVLAAEGKVLLEQGNGVTVNDYSDPSSNPKHDPPPSGDSPPGR